MYGRFYPEDIENIRQIDDMVAKKALADSKKQATAARRAARRRPH